jgi:ribosomal protein L30/L7E
VAGDTQVGKLRITLIKGLRGKKDDHRPQVRGMISKVGYMLRVGTAGQGQD